MHQGLESREMKAVEIFSTGHWSPATGGTMLVDERDLDDAVSSFEALHTTGGFRPVLKLGHSDSQKFFGNEHGAPNFGFVARIYRQGKKLLADFVDIPALLFDLIQKGRYNQLSIEMHPEHEFQGKKFRNIITGVAILGAEMPAVKGLAELASALMAGGSPALSFEGEEGDRVSLTKGESDVTNKTYTAEAHEALVEQITRAALAEVENKFSAERVELTGKIEAAEAKTAEAEARVAELTTERDNATGALRSFEAEKRAAQISGMVDGAIEKGTVLPAQRDKMIAMAASMAGTLKFGEGEEADPLATFGEFLGDLPKQVELNKEATGGDDAERPGERGKFGDAQAEVAELVKADMVATKRSYGEAFKSVMLTMDPALKTRYLAMGE